MPDHWAIDQIFPVLPLNRLNEQPERRAVLQDITCDSDGRIDLYVDGEGIETTLPLHAPKPGEPYLLGIFMLGAYQEILGDMHNLFGDTDSVHVEPTADGGYKLTQARRGDTVGSVLRYVHFDAEDLLGAYREKKEPAFPPELLLTVSVVWCSHRAERNKSASKIFLPRRFPLALGFYRLCGSQPATRA